jgi:hypothetical protein
VTEARGAAREVVRDPRKGRSVRSVVEPAQPKDARREIIAITKVAMGIH